MIAADRKASFFKGVTISASEWHAVELVNKVLKVGSNQLLHLEKSVYLVFFFFSSGVC